MYTIHFQKNSFPVNAALERWIRHLALYLAGRHPDLLDIEVHVGQTRQRRGGPHYRVRIALHTRGARRTVIGQSLVHVRSALRTAFDAAHAHLSRHARRRERVSHSETLPTAA